MIDITERKRNEDKLRYLATHDPMTGLANRNLFYAQLVAGLSRAARNGTGAAVLFLNLDNFKRINEAFDHHFGDSLLRETANRLRLAFRESDSVARFGGDEFAILMEDIDPDTMPASLSTIISRLLSTISRPVFINEREIQITASIGVSCYPGDGKSEDQLSRTRIWHFPARKRPGRITSFSMTEV